jgi:predicted membrane chloride channel (bestrophin family)
MKNKKFKKVEKDLKNLLKDFENRNLSEGEKKARRQIFRTCQWIDAKYRERDLDEFDNNKLKDEN